MADSGGGVATTDTQFRYSEEDGVISATYEGGTIRSGFLVGTRSGDRLDFRYVQLHLDGSTVQATAGRSSRSWMTAACGSMKRGSGNHALGADAASRRSCAPIPDRPSLLGLLREGAERDGPRLPARLGENGGCDASGLGGTSPLAL